jgi:pyruvate,orthophosphate dikinase
VSTVEEFTTLKENLVKTIDQLEKQHQESVDYVRTKAEEITIFC